MDLTRVQAHVQRSRVREGTKVGGALVLGVSAVSSAATLILLAAPLPPLSIAAGRVLVTGLVLCLLGAREIGALRRVVLDPSLRTKVLLAGALLAVHFGTWIASLTMTTVLRSTTLVALQPVFAGIVGRVLGDRVSKWLYVGALVSTMGTAMLVLGAHVDEGHGSTAGDVLALIGAASAAGYLAIGRSVRDVVPLRPYLGSVHLVAGLWLLGSALLLGPLVPAGVALENWGAVLYLGLVPGVIGHGLLNWAVRRMPVHIVSLAVLLEPLGSTALAWVVLSRGVTAFEVLGAAVVLLGVVLGMRTDGPSATPSENSD